MRRLALLLVLVTAGCGRAPALFVENNARAHVNMLADTIGSRPIGTPANARARDYIVEQLTQAGFDVRVQETDARRHELGRTARVSNIIAVLRGERPESIGLVSHYDSNPDAPGATDDALGVGVALEAARVFAAQPRRRWTLDVIVTDGEESGMMGAAALVADRDVMGRLQTYVNLESIGSSGPSMLFEAGPGNPWLLRPWARFAPVPRGSSYAIEIYRRLPNDTDFSILKTADLPGLNFAAVGDSYGYHTARDTADRLSLALIRSTGQNVVSILHALQDVDITQRSSAGATFFDIGGARGAVLGDRTLWIVGLVALVLGVIALVRVTAATIAEDGVLRWLLSVIWAAAGAAGAAGGTIAATWLLRSAREVYHPWYARPDRLFVLLVFAGALAAWSVTRVGQWLPRRAHPARHPALAWAVTLPAWIFLAAAMLWLAPSAAYLWVMPLFAAGLLLAIVPPQRDGAVRVASLVIVGVSATLWLRDAHDLLHFVVAVMGRLPIVTPVFAYGALVSAAGLMIVPPLAAAFASRRPMPMPWGVTAVLLIATAAAFGFAYAAPAYTFEQPLRRVVRVLQDGDRPSTLWEVGSVEPGLDLGDGAPSGWQPASTPAATSVPWGRLAQPFVFRTDGPPLGPPPMAVSAFTVAPVAAGQQVTLTLVPREPGLTFAIILPDGLTPARSSLPGVVRSGRWTAVFIAPPPEGISWQASFTAVAGERLRDIKVAVVSPRLPGGGGWQSLPPWLPQERAVWSATATWLVPATSGPAIAPVPPLR